MNKYYINLSKWKVTWFLGEAQTLPDSAVASQTIKYMTSFTHLKIKSGDLRKKIF